MPKHKGFPFKANDHIRVLSIGTGDPEFWATPSHGAVWLDNIKRYGAWIIKPKTLRESTPTFSFNKGYSCPIEMPDSSGNRQEAWVELTHAKIELWEEK